MIRWTTRRMALGVLALAALGRRAAQAAVPTPPQTAGPFYPPSADRRGDEDWDLVKVEGEVREAGGQVLHLAGRVLGRDGAPHAGAVIEIWQCDAQGRYLHAGDRQGALRDPAFQGFGRTLTDAEGRYRFRTIRPVAYPGRTPHIHARVAREDGSWLTTQLYVAGEPANQGDFIFRGLGRAGQKAASMDLAERDDGALETIFDFVV